MAHQRRFTSLSDLSQLLPDNPVPQKENPVPKGKRAAHDGKGKSVRIMLDTRDRKGKVVTLIIGLQHNPQTLEEIAKELKQYCGAGGTIREKTIEIQGDQRTKVTEKLLEMNYTVS